MKVRIQLTRADQYIVQVRPWWRPWWHSLGRLFFEPPIKYPVTVEARYDSLSDAEEAARKYVEQKRTPKRVTVEEMDL